MTYELILWLVCLPATDHVFPPEADAISWYNLRRVAADLELWPWEGCWGPNFGGELNWVRMRYADMYDAPPLSDVERLPSLALVSAQLDFAEKRLAYLQAVRAMRDWSAALETACEDQLWRQNVFLCLKQARECANGKPPNLISARHALRALRDDYLGAERYHLGQWPAHVHLGSFAPIP